MKKFLFAAIAAVTLSLSLGSAYAAQTTNSSLSSGAWINNQPPAFVYSAPGG
ncbi:MAG TPA: hypothetical protein VND19_15355 [Acetobacteraceae bacterium]|nr:hypothetical protein [Acetobacteraceae bacterium]